MPVKEDYLKDLHERYLETTSVLSKSFDVNEFKNYAKGAKKLYSHLLPKDKKTRILDIGCGQGHFLFYLLSEGFNNVTGVDISPEQVAFCKKYVTQNVFCSDYESWLKGEQYNVIVMNELLEHIPKPKIIPCLKQIYAALVGGGRVIIKVPNMRNPFNLAARYIDFTHEVGFTENSLYQVLTAAGFSNVEIEPKIQDSLKGLWRKPKRVIGYLVRKILVFILKLFFSISDRNPITGQPLNLFDKRIIAIAYKHIEG